VKKTREPKFDDQYNTDEEAEYLPFNLFVEEMKEGPEPQLLISEKEKEEYVKFKEHFYKQLRSGPYAKAGTLGIIREFPDTNYILESRGKNDYIIHNSVETKKASAVKPQVFISSIDATEHYSDSGGPSNPFGWHHQAQDSIYPSGYNQDGAASGSGSGRNQRRDPQHPLLQENLLGQRGPLSHQQASYEDSEYQVCPCKVSHYSTSLQFDRSEDGSIQKGLEPLQSSSLHHFACKKELLNPQLKVELEIITNKNKKEKPIRGQPAGWTPKVLKVPKDRIQFINPYEQETKQKTSLLKLLPNLLEGFKEAIRDEEELKLFKQTLSFTCFLQTIFLFFLAILAIIGILVHIGAGYLFLFSVYLHWLLMQTFNRWSGDFAKYLAKREEKRRRLHNDQGRPKHVLHPSDPLRIGQSSSLHFKGKVVQLQGLSLWKPGDKH
jgi:hypothetical protein